MQGPHERDQSRDLRRAEVPAIGRHIAPALDHLPDQLVSGQARRHVVERRAALAAFPAQAMTIATLLVLQYRDATQFARRKPYNEFLRHGGAAPCLPSRR